MCGSVNSSNNCALVCENTKKGDSTILKVKMQGVCAGFDPNHVYRWGQLAKSSKNSPCTNVPVKCELCTNLCLWKYNMQQHYKDAHAGVSPPTQICQCD